MIKKTPTFFYKIKMGINNIQYSNFTKIFRKTKFETIYEEQKINIFQKTINNGDLEKMEILHNPKQGVAKKKFVNFFLEKFNSV